LIIKVKILELIQWSYRSPNYVECQAYDDYHIPSTHSIVFRTHLLLIVNHGAMLDRTLLKYRCYIAKLVNHSGHQKTRATMRLDYVLII
jgi:hypothetical protein